MRGTTIVISPIRGYIRGSFMHEHRNTKAVLNRLSRAIGHLTAVKKMIENERDCSEVLIQLAAVRAEIGNIGKIVLKDHIDCCISEAVATNDTEALNALKSAVDKLL